MAGLPSIIQAQGRNNRNGEHPLRDGYVVNIADENLSGLPDIKRGAREVERLLEEIKANPRAYDGDIMSPAAIARYYKYYFHKTGETMDFPLKDPPTSLYDLLSANRLGVKALGNKGRVAPVLSQAFETARQRFHIIEQSAAVIVPYGCGEAVIAELNSGDVDIKRKKKLLKSAERYSVNLFDRQIRELDKKNGLHRLAEDILVLKDGYYDSDIGFRMDKRLNLAKQIR
jgi:CRISPR-associated endonuclease/helicase Cas3